MLISIMNDPSFNFSAIPIVDSQQPVEQGDQQPQHQVSGMILANPPQPQQPIPLLSNSNTVHQHTTIEQIPIVANVAAPTATIPAIFTIGTDQQLQLNITGLDLNRLRQMQQQPTINFNIEQPSTTAPQQPNQNQAELMRSYMDQKLRQAQLENQLRQRLIAAPADPLIQPPLLADAGLLVGKIPYGSIRPGQTLTLPSPHELTYDTSRRMRGGVIEPFPEKLHRLLLECEALGRSDVISFIANGRAFAIHKPDKFFKEIVPNYFRQSRLSSFKRQLNLYGFELINSGPARGGYFHEMFIKDRPELCRRMRRVAVKVNQKPKQETKKAAAPEKSDIDIYNIDNIHGCKQPASSQMPMPPHGDDDEEDLLL